MRTRSLVVTAAAVLALLAGCSKDTSDGPAATPPEGSGSIGEAPATPTPAATSAAPPAASYPTDAGAYATAAVTAWRTGDTARLGQLDSPGDTIFATLSAGDYNKEFALYQCQGAAGSSICAFYNAVGDELDLRLSNQALGQAHAIADGQWHPITFPEDLKAYATEAIEAWGRHNDAAVALLTGKPGSTAFSPVPAERRGDAWTFDHQEGAMGHLVYVFGNPAGDAIVVQFANPSIVAPPANRHGLIEVVIYDPH